MRNERRLNFFENYSSYLLYTSFNYQEYQKYFKLFLNYLIFIIFFLILLLLLLWDMSHLNHLSNQIHNNHSYLWSNINHNTLKKWLSLLDICILNNLSSNLENYNYSLSYDYNNNHNNNNNNSSNIITNYYNQNILELSLNSCSKYIPIKLVKKNDYIHDNISHPRLFCSIILGLGRDCYAPYYHREYYYKKLINLVTGNKTMYSLKNTMRYLGRKKKSFLFIGDATTKQNLQALFCEMLRIDTVSFIGDVYNPTNVTMKWLGKQSSLSSLSIKFHYLSFHGFIDHEHDKDKDDDDHNNDKKDNKDKNNQKNNKESNENENDINSDLTSHLLNYTDGENSNGNENIIVKLEGSVSGGEKVITPEPNLTISTSIESNLTNNRNRKLTKRSITSSSTTTTTTTTNRNRRLLEHNINSHHLHHYYDFHTLKHLVNLYQEIYPGGLVVVFNIGSAYTSRMKYREDVNEILEWLDELGENEKGNKILFRETAAQHWNHTSIGYQSSEENDVHPSLKDFESNENEDSNNNDNKHHSGSYDSSSHYQPPSECVPIADFTSTADWKNQEIKSCIKNNNYQNIHLIPFRDITAPLHSMHLTPPGISSGWNLPGYEQTHHHHMGLVDCTHYCYFPQMWESVWTTMSYFILSHSKVDPLTYKQIENSTKIN